MEEENYEYSSMSAQKALNLVDSGHLLLPDIQREYCWSMNDIENLFDSLASDYPIGSFIFWKVDKQTINKEKPNLYKFITNYKYKETENESAPTPITEEGDYYIVLDGQQRITSLSIALKGSYTARKKYKWKKNEDSWFESELYYNLDYYDNKVSDIDEQDERIIKKFVFLDSKNMPEKGNYYLIKEMLGFDSVGDLAVDLNNRHINKQSSDEIQKIYNKIKESSNKAIIHYYCINNDSYNNALNIFVKVNSTGVKLSKTDLLFSTLISQWSNRKNPKKEIDQLIKSQNRKGDKFEFTRDYLMRLCLVLVDANTTFDIKSLDTNTIDKIILNWDKISKVFKQLVDLLVKLRFSDKILTSYNATMPIAYYLYKGGSIKNDSYNEVKKFLSISMAKGLFGVASNTALTNTRKAIADIDCTKTPFSMKIFDNVVLTDNRKFIVTKDEIKNWVTSYDKGPNTYVLLTLLYPFKKFSSIEFHQDHCHPYVLFEDKYIKGLKLSDQKIKEWKTKRNHLPNLQLLEGPENESKNKTPLEDWLNADSSRSVEYLPNTVSLKLKDFDDFYSKRSELMIDELTKVFDAK